MPVHFEATIRRRGPNLPSVLLGGILGCLALMGLTIGYTVWATYFSGSLVADAPLVPDVPMDRRSGPGEITIPCRALGPLGLDASINPLRVTLVARGTFCGYGHEDVLQCRVLGSGGRLVSVLDGAFRAPPMRSSSGRAVRGITVGEFELVHHDMYTIEPTFYVWRGLPRASMKLVVRRNVVSAEPRLIVAGFVGAILSLVLGLIGRLAQRSAPEHRAAA